MYTVNTPKFDKAELRKEYAHAQRSIVCYNGKFETIAHYYPKLTHNGKLSIMDFMKKDFNVALAYDAIDGKTAVYWLRGIYTHFDLCEIFQVEIPEDYLS